MKKYLVTICAMVLTSSAMAQSSDDDDFGLNLSVAAEKELLPALDINVSAEMRTQENTQRVERYMLGAELGYKFYNTKTFDMKVSGGFEYMWNQKMEETKFKTVEDGRPSDKVDYNVNERYWRQRHRTSLGLSFDYSPSKRWSFQLKETVQYNHYCAGDSINQMEHRFIYNSFPPPGQYMERAQLDKKAVEAKDRFVLRSKFTVEYNIKGVPVNPFASVDYGCGLNYTTNKWKYSVGADYNINKKNRLTVYYRFQTEDDDDEPNGHMVGLGYKVKF